MILLNSLLEYASLSNSSRPLGVTLGNFDGVHLGHQQVLRKIKEQCHQKGELFTVITFRPHPHEVLVPPKRHFLITSYDEKRFLLKEVGVEILVELKFNKELSQTRPEEFLENYIYCSSLVKDLYLGHDFAFGIQKSGDFHLAKKIGQIKSVHVHLMDEYKVKGEQVSSTEIRKRLQVGDIEGANKYLGRKYFFSGKVEKGANRGKVIGFPTANIPVEENLLVPKPGVYITGTLLNNRLIPSVTNIGSNPTFGNEENVRVETHLIDLNENLYDQFLKVIFYKRIRDEVRFNTPEELKKQIQKDVNLAREFKRND